MNPLPSLTPLPSNIDHSKDCVSDLELNFSNTSGFDASSEVKNNFGKSKPKRERGKEGKRERGEKKEGGKEVF